MEKYIDFICVSLLVACFVAVGFMVLLLPARNLDVLCINILVGVFFSFMPLLLGGILGIDWIDSNISIN